MAPVEIGPLSPFKAKLNTAVRLMAAKGLRRSSYAPPLHQLVWLCNIPLRPPHFSSFLSNVATMGGFFGTAWGALMWLLIWQRSGMSGAAAIVQAAIGGVLFGIAMAAYFSYSARKHKLPAWSELSDEAEIFD
jgi:hypothetical protein